MGFFEDKLMWAGRVLDDVVARAAGSSASGAWGRRRDDIASWARERTDRLDHALARRGIRVSSMLVVRAMSVVVLLGMTGLTVRHAVASMRPPMAPHVTPEQQGQMEMISQQIMHQKRKAAAEEAARPQRRRAAPGWQPGGAR